MAFNETQFSEKKELKKAPAFHSDSKKQFRIGIVCAQFNPHITKKMLDSAKQFAAEENLLVEKILEVPGSFEIPFATQQLLERKEIEGVVCLGAIIKGSTSHDEVIGHAIAAALLDLSLKYKKPIGFGVTGHGQTEEQAKERAEEYARRSVMALKQMLLLE
jgi:6,7-dimethyl-8-ribityllumazine synthase